MDSAGITNVGPLGAGGASAGITNLGPLGAGGARERFHVHLTPGETNIVSLKKLRREAGEVVSDDSSEENEAEKYIFLKLPRTKRNGALGIRDTRTASVPLTGARKSGNGNLDQTILQLKNLVKHSNIPVIDVQEPNASLLDIEKQLSPELKQNLAEVARSTQLIEGKISKELINRLMSILGKYLKRKTLKKILREMILEDLYASKANCISFKEIKKDLVKMIRLETASSTVKIHPNSELSTGTYSMSDQLEDKLYDVYDTFCQGPYKDIGPSLVRRLYAKLAELWPKDTMGRNEIQEAIWRARERRMVLNNKEA